MIALRGKITTRRPGESFIARVTTNAHLPLPLRTTEALLLTRGSSVDRSGFRTVLSTTSVEDGSSDFTLPDELSYLDDGDIIRVEPTSENIRVLYRRRAPFNGLFVTERCNSKCLMCSQPPRQVEDGFLAEDLLHAIPLMSPETAAIGFTGGEITLLHERFLELMQATKSYLPTTKVDVLSNGRLMMYNRYAERLGAIGHEHLTMCVPLYADVDSLHDFVVQAQGGFDQTVRGILNLAGAGVAVEIRVVLHKVTIPRLTKLAEFIRMNFPFVRHVALMGLEMMGFTKANLPALWIDPFDYQRELGQAVELLDAARLHVSIYNHQLCVLPRELWPFARKSISDWKNIYYPECDQCAVKTQCGGFFASSSLRRSDHIKALI